MLNAKKLLTKVLDTLSVILGGTATIEKGTISFPYTATKDGILTIRIASTNAGQNTSSYAYFSIDETIVAGWSGHATGGTNSVCFGVKKGEQVNMIGAQISSFNYRLLPALIGGGTS